MPLGLGRLVALAISFRLALSLGGGLLALAFGLGGLALSLGGALALGGAVVAGRTVGTVRQLAITGDDPAVLIGAIGSVGSFRPCGTIGELAVLRNDAAVVVAAGTIDDHRRRIGLRSADAVAFTLALQTGLLALEVGLGAAGFLLAAPAFVLEVVALAAFHALAVGAPLGLLAGGLFDSALLGLIAGLAGVPTVVFDPPTACGAALAKVTGAPQVAAGPAGARADEVDGHDPAVGVVDDHQDAVVEAVAVAFDADVERLVVVGTVVVVAVAVVADGLDVAVVAVLGFPTPGLAVFVVVAVVGRSVLEGVVQSLGALGVGVGVLGPGWSAHTGGFGVGQGLDIRRRLQGVQPRGRQRRQLVLLGGAHAGDLVAGAEGAERHKHRGESKRLHGKGFAVGGHRGLQTNCGQGDGLGMNPG